MSVTYKLNPTTASSFTPLSPATFTTFTGAQSFTINRTGDETTLGSDGLPFMQGSFIDNLSYTVSVESTENFKALKVGDVGTLVLRSSERANGEGVHASNVMTFTSETNCAVCTSVDHTVNHAGNSTCTANFRVVSTDGTTDPITVA
jgi:hypothetical protein